MNHRPLLILCLLAAMTVWPIAARVLRGAEGPHPTGREAAVKFATVAIYIDSGPTALAAYQLDFRATDPRVKIVGIEGGEHEAFADPPYYDPAAMMGERVIAAAFSLNEADRLPVGRTRIMTLHLQSPADAADDYQIELTTSADIRGANIPADITIEKGHP